MKKTEKSVSGTSFHDSYVHATINELEKALWQAGPGDGYKTTNEWAGETSNGDVFTIYDWKEYRAFGKDEKIQWHIGGCDRDVTETAKEEIERKL